MGKNNQPTIIPERLQHDNFNFVLIDSEKGGGKKPKGGGWQKRIIRFDNPELIKHLEKGFNYGVQPNGSIINVDGENRFLIIIDFDKKEIQDKVLDKFPETFTTTSGSSKNCFHLWFACDDDKAFKIKDEKKDTLADIIGAGNQVIAPGSKHNSGSIYSIVKDVDFAFISHTEIEAILNPLDRTPKKPSRPKKQWVPRGVSNTIGEEVINKISMENILIELGINTEMNPTNCFGHSSNGGKCFSWDNEKAHCFHCQNLNDGWNKFSLIREAKNFTDKETFDWFAEKAGMKNELDKERKEYSEKNKIERSKDIIGGNILLDRITQAKQYHKINPFFYDKNKIWFVWNKEKYRWEKSDEVDILANIYDDAGADITTSKERTEITNALKHVGRRNIPKELNGYWVQYKNKLYNIEDDGILKASPNFFITNPIPHKIGENEETPTIDKLFVSWVGEEHKQELYEVLAFAQAPRYFIHRIICLIGSGANGKSTFLTLLRNYLDDDNVVSSSLEALMKVRFEGSKLYRKLVCLMGETNFGTMTQTDYIKGLSGEDKMRIEFKGKDGFDVVNNAKLILATNSLPMTADKTDGFYRRWKIIKFDNKFPEEKDVLVKIPKEEYSNLTKKCLRILKEMWQKRIFTNDGNFEYRKANYEKHSNPLVLFLDQNFEKDVNSDYLTEDFREELLEFLSEHGFRELSPRAITQQLKINGYEIKQIKRGGIDRKRILGIKRKLTSLTSLTSDTSVNPTHIICKSQNERSDVSDVSDVKPQSPQEMKVSKNEKSK